MDNQNIHYPDAPLALTVIAICGTFCRCSRSLSRLSTVPVVTNTHSSELKLIPRPCALKPEKHKQSLRKHAWI